MKVKLFTHDDFDGVGCGIIGKLAFQDNIDIEYCNYDDVNIKVKDFITSKQYQNYRFVYITDISINEEVANLIDNTQPDTFKEGFCLGEMFQLLDHHDTALWLNKYFWVNVEVNNEGLDEPTSGTKLFYDFLLQEGDLVGESAVSKFVDTVRKYDTWLWKNKYNDIIPKQWNDLLYILGRDRFIEETLFKLNASNFSFNCTDSLLLKLEQEKIDKYIESKYKNIMFKEVKGYVAGVVFAEQHHSELGNRLSEKHPGLDFIIIINMDKSVSYRTTKDYVHLGNDIAKVYGGGGHAKAAGSPIGNEIRESVLEMIFDKQGGDGVLTNIQDIKQPLYTNLIMELSQTYIKNGEIIKNRGGYQISTFAEINNFNNIVIEDDRLIDIFCAKDMRAHYQNVIDKLANMLGQEIREKISINCKIS